MRAVLVVVLILTVGAVGAFVYLRARAPELDAEPTKHAPATSLVVIDLHVKRAIESTPLAHYVEDRISALPEACGRSPLSYLERISAFLVPGENNHPDWGLVAPHLPPADVLEPCLEAVFEKESLGFESFGWSALLKLGLRWGGNISGGEHELVSPLHGGLVVGESATVRAVLDIARGQSETLASDIDSRLNANEQQRLAQNLPDAIVRAIVIPPQSQPLQSYWSERLPGIWPSLRNVRVATAGLALEDGLRVRATVLGAPGTAEALRAGLAGALARAQTVTAMAAGLNMFSEDVLRADGDWLTLDITIPTSLLSLFSAR